MNILKIDKIPQALNNIVKEAGKEAVRFSKDRFVHKNWLDSSRQKWKKTNKRKGSTLVNTGTLKRSIRIVARSSQSVTIGTDVPYAKIHNEGGTINTTQYVRSHSRKRKARTQTVKAHKRTMNLKIEQRQFLGQSRFLNKKIERMMEFQITKALS